MFFLMLKCYYIGTKMVGQAKRNFYKYRHANKEVLQKSLHG